MGSEESTREKLDLEETRMLRWMSGDTKLDRIRSEIYPGKCRRVWACIEIRSRTCGQESDGDGGAGKRRRGRPKGRWLDNIKNDLSLVGERIVRRGSARPG